jgi:phosphoenolpyruvate synthase/pyruvate phosphate dikinase
VIINYVGEKVINNGDILVAKAADPGWTPLFINASGVLLEVGGMLQHGSLIAREYGKPCIAGIQKVTELLKDGDLVEMDGSNGIVKKLV